MPVWLHLGPEQVGKGQERKKINIVCRFFPTQRVIENSKKIAKKFKKIKKIPLWLHFKPPQVEGG